MHDVVGNRTRRVAGGTTTDYGWDTVNRMTAHAATAGTNGFSYKFRADGMRVYKRSGVTSIGNGIFAQTLAGFTVHRTYYDGQTPLEESVTTSGNTTLTRNFVGARGIEAMFLTQNGATTTS